MSTETNLEAIIRSIVREEVDAALSAQPATTSLTAEFVSGMIAAAVSSRATPTFVATDDDIKDLVDDRIRHALGQHELEFGHSTPEWVAGEITGRLAAHNDTNFHMTPANVGEYVDARMQGFVKSTELSELIDSALARHNEYDHDEDDLMKLVDRSIGNRLDRSEVLESAIKSILEDSVELRLSVV